MTAPGPYGFRPASDGDLTLLNLWIKSPHVTRWWAAGKVFEASDFVRPGVACWIVSFEGAPRAYMQDYALHGPDPHPYDHLPRRARGIDQFIGPAQFTGKGHGPGFIRQRVDALFAAGAPVIVTDPHPRNARAISAYRKAGFQAEGPEMDTRWGRVRPMMARR